MASPLDDAQSSQASRHQHPANTPAWPACGVEAWLFALLAIVSVAGLLRRASASAPPSPSELAWWCVLILGIQLFPVRSKSGMRLDFDLPVLLAVAFVFGPGIGTAVAAIAYVDLQEWNGRLTLGHAAFNRSIRVLSVAAAGIVFRLLGGLLVGWPRVLVSGCLAVLADIVVNYGLGALVVNRLTHTGFRRALEQMRLGPFPGFLAAYVAYGCLAVPMAALYERVGDWTLVTFLIPGLIARQAFSRAQQLEDARGILAEKDNAMRHVSQQIIQERNDERLRIASSLHDDVLQSLHFLTLHAQVIKEDLRHGRLLQLEEDVPLLLQKSQETAELTRGVISDLRSSPLGRGGVSRMLAEFARDIADEFGGTIELDIQAILGDSTRQTSIYQVGREAIANAVKHSRATRIWVSLKEESGTAHLVVRDNGSGFAAENGVRPNHFGLTLMRERVGATNGRLSLDSAPGQGTRLEAWFPDSAK